MYFGYQRFGSETWGTASIPTKSAAELQLDKYLQNVVANGTVVDVGAGSGLSLEASIHVRRPDIQIIAVDPGFEWAHPDDLELSIDEVVGYLTPDQQSILKSSQSWRANLLPGLGEALPAEDQSADMVLSYSAIPEYALDYDRSLQECLRVLKLGGIALHGPMHDWVFEDWGRLIEEASNEGKILDYSSRVEVLKNAYDDEVSAYFTLFRKALSVIK